MPLLWLSISVVTGIFLSQYFGLPVYFWTALLGMGILLVLIERFVFHTKASWKKLRSVIPLYPGLLLIALAIGGLRFHGGQKPITSNSLAYYNDRGTYTITARIFDPPDKREDAVYLDLTVIEIEDPLASDPQDTIRVITGKLRVRMAASTDYQIGDVLRFTGAPLTPSEDERFSYKDYLARQQIGTVMYYPRSVQLVDHVQTGFLRAKLESLRQKAREILFSQYPQPESSLLAGILLGLERDMPQSLVRSYQQTGTAHIIAISGFNMGVLAFVFMKVFSRVLNRYWAVLVSALVIMIYTVFVGGSPSVIRAAIMAVTAFGGHLVGRRQSGLNALGFTAALMCLFNPLLLEDVSFQLSFAATLGLVLFADPLGAWARDRLTHLLPEGTARRISEPLNQYLLFTLAAQLLTFPIIAYHFGRISFSSFLANPLILPAQPPLLIMGGISTILGAISPALGKIASLFTWPLASYSNFIADQFSRMISGSLAVDPQIALFLLAFVVLFILLFIFRGYLTKHLKGKYYWIIYLLVLGAISIWSIIIHRPDGYLHVNLLRAGEKSVLMFYTPSGQTVLFDPGKEVNEISAAVSRQLSPWSYRIDQTWLSTAPTTRYLGELDERIPVKSVVLPPVVYRAGAESGPVTIPVNLTPIKLKPGEAIEIDEEMIIRVVAESADTAAFIVEHEQVKILVPNGVDYTLIKEEEPTAFTGLSVLVLNESDISYIPPRVWQALEPRVVLWNSPTLCPVEGWRNLEQSGNISIISDGRDIFLDQ